MEHKFLTKALLALSITVTGITAQQVVNNEGEAYVRGTTNYGQFQSSQALKTYYSQTPIYLYNEPIYTTRRSGVYEVEYNLGPRQGTYSAFIKNKNTYADESKVNVFLLQDTADRAGFTTS